MYAVSKEGDGTGVWPASRIGNRGQMVGSMESAFTSDGCNSDGVIGVMAPFPDGVDK